MAGDPVNEAGEKPFRPRCMSKDCPSHDSHSTEKGCLNIVLPSLLEGSG